MMERPLNFAQTIRPLALAVLPGVLVIALPMLASGITPPPSLLLLWFIAPLAYAAAAVFVLPLFAVWPASRLPSFPIAALWGGVSSYAAMLLVFGTRGRTLLDAALLFAAAPGALSGLAYAWLAARKTKVSN